MRALRICLALLCALGGNAFASDKIADVGQEVVNTTGSSKDVALCSDTGCGAVKTLPSPSSMGCNQYMLPLPQGTPKACYWGPVGQPVTLPTATVEVPTYSDTCLPDIPVLVWQAKFKILPTPPSVSTVDPYTVVWQEAASCGGKVRAQMFNATDLNEFIAKKFSNNAELNAWGKARTTVGDAAGRNWMAQSKAAYAAELGVPVDGAAPPTFTMWVTPGPATRPYYKANTAGTNISTKLGDVAEKKDCDQSKRLGTTNYYWVPSVSGYAVCALR